MRSCVVQERYARGLEALRDAVALAARQTLRPPPKLTLSQWAERYAVLSKETSAQTGRFRPYPYQISMLDAFTDPTVEQITVMKSARVGYTKILDHAVGYFIHQDPSPILVVQPRVEDAEDYSATEIEPMLRDTPELAAILGGAKGRDSKQKLLKRVFRNGASVSFVGANSPGGFRRITCRIVLFDEVDGYPAGGAGEEGDQIKLGSKRAETFWNRKVAAGSTPTISKVSRIEKRWEASDQRRYFVPCPHCGEMQVLEWGAKDAACGIKWRRDAQGRALPETAYYLCRQGCVIEEADKAAMVAAGQWRATRPFRGHAGFHIWTGYSLHVNAAWSRLVEEWLEAKDDPLERQTFVNLVLGLPYEERGTKALSEARLLAQREAWPGEVPDGVAVVTVGVDVQDNRVELEFVGWGRDEESWSIAHEVVEGDPDGAALWQAVDALLKREWRTASGRGVVAMAACVDSGGHHTQRVYDFARERLGRRVWAVKGEAARGGARSPVWPTKKPSARNKQAFRPVIIGVNAAKDAIRTRLHLDPPGVGEARPGFMHFPADRDAGWFAQLVAERLVVKHERGQRFRVWELPTGRANEALDCRVYAYAALCGLLHLGLKLNRRVEQVEAESAAPAAPPAELAAHVPRTVSDPVSSGATPAPAPARAEPSVTVTRPVRSLAGRLA